MIYSVTSFVCVLTISAVTLFPVNVIVVLLYFLFCSYVAFVVCLLAVVPYTDNKQLN